MPRLVVPLAFSPAVHVDIAVVIAGAALAACAVDPAVVSPSSDRLQLTDCMIRDAARTRTVAAKCGRVSVPEDYDNPAGKKLALFVAVVPALAKVAAPDAFVHIAGGPGMASSTDYALWGSAAFAGLRPTRDVVLVDQRGTGKSHRLDCTSVDADSADLDLVRIEEDARRCFAAQTVDPRQFTTSVAVRDLEAVRAALGYERVNLYGVSYGTRVALHYLRRYPDRVRTMILDGVVPADRGLGPDLPVAAQRALDLILDRCEQTPGCNTRFGGIKEDFWRLYRNLEDKPTQVSFRHPRLGTPETLTVSHQHLATVVRFLSYRPQTAALIPLLIDGALHHEGLDSVAAQFMLLTQNLERDIAYGMHLSVVCTEDVPFLSPTDADAEALDKTYLGARMVESLRALCRGWPKGTIDEDFKAPVKADHPVLLLSGEADPVTPPSNADRAAETLTNALHIVAADQGHGVAPLECVRKLIKAFVENASVEGLDTGCLNNEVAAPFFVTQGGPNP